MTISKSIYAFCFILLSISINAQQIIDGIVKDINSDEMLIGATISLRGSLEGTISDKDGLFILSSNKEFPWTLDVSFIGYKSIEYQIDGPKENLVITLQKGINIGNEIIISASRRSEKVTDSPASISVMTDAKIETQAKSGEPLELIKSINGVQLNQQGINRANITLRGASGVNQTTAQVLKDYRPLVNPGDYYLATARSTISDIDIEQIEVIRGPSGALYGPGVSAGVVHFISKDPFNHPGTTVSMSAGERSVLKANLRHAGHNESRTFGYKLSAGYTSGNDWTLNDTDANAPNGGISFSDHFISEKGEKLDIPNNLIEFFRSHFVEGTIDYRPIDDMSIVLASSVAENKGNDRITPGDLYRYWRVWNNQVRVKYGSFFGAVNYQVTPGTDGSIGSPGWSGQYAESAGGSSLLYTEGDQSFLDVQLQYVFDIEQIKTDFTVGTDYKSSVMDGNDRNAGRFEMVDDYKIYGGYLQAKTEFIEDKLDMIVAARFDEFSAFDDSGFSPRIGFMYKPNDHSQLRASYNRSFTPSGQVRAFLDFTISTTPWGRIQVLGSHAPITFNNPTSDFFPGFLPDGYNGIGSDLNPIYNFISNGPLAAAGLNPDLLAYLKGQSILGSTEGALNVFLAGGRFGDPVSDIKLLETEAAKLTMTQALELGYKGVIADKLVANVDFYYMKLKDFESNALGVSPFLSLPNLADDLRNSIISNLDANDIAALGGDISQIAGIYANIAENALGGPIGAVQTDQAQQVEGTQVNFGFQSIGDLNYWGFDLGLEYYLGTNLSVYSNYGYISQNVFTPQDIGEVADGFNLNTPQNKLRFGLNYLPANGVFGGFHFLFDEDYLATNGIYSGTAESRTVIDLNVGYKFTNGLKLSINTSNLLNNKYQAFPRLPEIGRLAILNITYSFNNDK